MNQNNTTTKYSINSLLTDIGTVSELGLGMRFSNLTAVR